MLPAAANGDLIVCEPLDPHHEGRGLALEVICRLFHLDAEAANLDERGVRAHRRKGGGIT